MNEDDLFAALEADMQNLDTSNIIDVSKLSILEIADKIAEVTNTLFEMREAIIPRSQKARDLHSLRNALQVELSKR